MSATRKIRKPLRDRLDRYELKPAFWVGAIGNAAGDLYPDVSDRLYIWVRDFGGLAHVVFNQRVPVIAGSLVKVGRHPERPSLEEVIGSIPVWDAPVVNTELPSHGHTHAFPEYDTSWIRGEQFMPWMAAPSGMTVIIYPAATRTGTGWMLGTPTAIDLTAEVPSFGAVEVLISVDENGEYVKTVGANASPLTISIADVPPVPANCQALWAVKLTAGQTSIEGIDETNGRWLYLYDLRWGGSTQSANGYTAIATNGMYWYAIQVGQNAVVHANNKTFVFFMGDDFDEWCVVLDRSTNTWSDPVEIADGHTSDDFHNYASAIIDDDGYIHIAYGCHDSALYYKKSTNPYDVSAWSGETSLASAATYPKWIKDSTGALYLFYRDAPGGAGKGRYFRYRKSTDGGSTWAAAVTVVDSGSDTIRVYAAPLSIDAGDGIHLIWTWLDTTYSGELVPGGYYDVCYAVSRDGGATWEQSDGTGYSLPIGTGSAETVATGSSLFAGNVMADADGKPRIVYVVSDPSVYFTKVWIHYCYLDAGVWQDVTMPGQDYDLSSHILVDGPKLHVFSVQVIGDRREVILFRSLDDGATWDFYQLTFGSTIDNVNVVPKYERGELELVWAQGNGYDPAPDTASVLFMAQAAIEARAYIGWQVPTDTDEKVKTSANDETPGYLNGKLVAGTGISLSESGGTDRTLTITSTGGPASGQYRQFVYEVSGGTFSFVVDEDGEPILALEDLE